MNGWAGFWYFVVWAALSTYFSLAVLIVIGGFFDVQKMFRRLDQAHQQAETAATGTAAPADESK